MAMADLSAIAKHPSVKIVAACDVDEKRTAEFRKKWPDARVYSDFRELLASKEPRARFAVEAFCYWTARQIASLAAALGGLDGVVFTAGVGENAAPIRAAICDACAWLGVRLDAAANAAHRTRITTRDSRVGAYVIRTDENLMIARHASALLRGPEA